LKKEAKTFCKLGSEHPIQRAAQAEGLVGAFVLQSFGPIMIEVSWFGWTPFLRPGLQDLEVPSGAFCQAWPKATAQRREAGLTEASTAPSLGRSGDRASDPPSTAKSQPPLATAEARLTASNYDKNKALCPTPKVCITNSMSSEAKRQ